MKVRSILVFGGLVAFFTSCGPSEEEISKTIDQQTTLRAKQICEELGKPESEVLMTPIETVSQYSSFLDEVLVEEGLDAELRNKAADILLEKCKNSCPELMPK